jgi:RNA polymerase sigma-70 factor (ECF subfamily)
MTQVPAREACNGEGANGSVTELISAARGGCARSRGELAERYRKYLLHVAHGSLGPELRAKVGASDLVQETLLEFHEHFERFDGDDEQELLAWTRRILYFRALQAARRYGGTAARDVRREISLGELAGSAYQAPLVDGLPTPCSAAIAEEAITDVEAALITLPEEARRLIELRNVERKSFAEIGALLDCTPNAARKRWRRAIAQLRLALAGHE